MEEEVVAVFHINEPRRFGFRYYNMFLTDKRLILGKIGSGASLSFFGKSGKIGTAFINWGFLGLAKLAMQQDDSHKYDDMNLEGILKADKDNFALAYQSDLKSVELKERTLGIGKKVPSKMVINPNHSKKKAFFFNKDDFDDLKRLLENWWLTSWLSNKRPQSLKEASRNVKAYTIFSPGQEFV